MTNRLTITLADGETLTVTPNITDRLAFESTLRKNKGWGQLQDNALRMQAFIGWHAARREHGLALTFAEFTTGDTAARDVSQAHDEPADEPETDELGAVEVDGLGEGGAPDPYTL